MKFSVLMPTFKPFYLEKAINSVLRQTFKDWELVIVNDASPYDIESVVSKFHDNRIKYYTNKTNYGAIDVVKNWNRCLELSQGIYVVMMGDDDMLSDNCLEMYEQCIKKYPNFDIFHGRTLMIDEKDNPVMLQDARPETESVFSAIWERIDHRQQFIGDYLFKADALKMNGGFYFLPLAWGSDDISIFRAIGSKGIGNINIPVFMYRINPYSITSSGKVDIKMQAMKKAKEWMNSFVESLPVNNEIDRILQGSIKKRMNNYFLKKTSNLIACDIAVKGISRIWYWNTLLKNYSLPKALLAYSFVYSFKIKRETKIKK